jgi:L-ascorbate metabolism protein UlaG (beta-lactamase superfamily)
MFAIALLGLISLFSLGCSVGPVDTTKPHHTANGFRNVHPYRENGFLDFLRWRVDRRAKDIPGPEAYHFPVAENDKGFLQANRDAHTVTWIGHATVLLQMAGVNILTDPQFSRRASPVQWAGPERVVRPGLALADLPPIDVVLISHDHYDSLDKDSVLALRRRPGGEHTRFFVPLGFKRWFEGLSIENVIELDWWETHRDGALDIAAVPVQHWSKRRLLGRNTTLWAGWVVQSPDFRFLFAGDSGYTPHFREIGERFGPIDLAALPIGAYEPRWFMASNHMTPEEAVRVHQDVRSRKSIAIHWGTFILTDEPLTEPPERLASALEKNAIPPDEFVVLKHGETLMLGARP